jgi:hypothetical protein
MDSVESVAARLDAKRRSLHALPGLVSSAVTVDQNGEPRVVIHVTEARYVSATETAARDLLALDAIDVVPSGPGEPLE